MTKRYSDGYRKMLLGDTTLGDKSFREIFLNGVMYGFAGVQPSSANADVTGYTLVAIGSADGGSFSFGSPTNAITWGDATLDAATQKIYIDIAVNLIFKGVANGVIGWCRLMGNDTDNLGTSLTLPRIDFSVGVTSGDIRIAPSTSIVVDGLYPATIRRISLPYQAT